MQEASPTDEWPFKNAEEECGGCDGYLRGYLGRGQVSQANIDWVALDMERASSVATGLRQDCHRITLAASVTQA